MRKLSWDTGHSAAWLVLAAALWATGDRWARRAAWRGLGSMLAARRVRLPQSPARPDVQLT
jgi:hypothetical protein